MGGPLCRVPSNNAFENGRLPAPLNADGKLGAFTLDEGVMLRDGGRLVAKVRSVSHMDAKGAPLIELAIRRCAFGTTPRILPRWTATAQL